MLSCGQSFLSAHAPSKAAGEPGTYLVNLRFRTQSIAIPAIIIRKLAGSGLPTATAFPTF
ncbi:MAG: hypothetical protein ABI977_28765 [Acidobacteriota bacterium]